MKNLFKTLLIGTLFTLGCAAVAVESPDPVIGTWTLNVAKSKFTPGPAPKSGTRIYAPSGDGIAMTVSQVAADGSTSPSQSTYKYDGQDYAITGVPGVDMLSLKKVNGTTVNATMKLSGKVVGSTVRSISRHGKVLTLTTHAKSPDGKKYSYVAVYDKQ